MDGGGEDDKEDYSEARPRASPSASRCCVEGPAPLGCWDPSASSQAGRRRGASAPTHFPGAQAPPRGRSRGAARRLAAALRQLLSPHGQLRLGDGLTEPGPEPLGAGLGRAGEFPRRRRPSPAGAGGDEDRGGEGVPAAEGLVGGVWGAWAKGWRLEVIGGGGTGTAGAGSAGRGVAPEWGRSPGLARLRRGQGRGRIGRLLAAATVARSGGSLWDFGCFCRGAQCREAGATTGIRRPGRPASRPGVGAPPPRVEAPGPRGERSCLGGKGPPGGRPRVRTRPAAGSS